MVNYNNFDAIIIGAGIGGLFAAAKCAREGLKVIVIEQHSIPGGYAGTFQRQDFTFEIGLHALDGFFPVNNRSANLNIFRELGIFDAVKFIRLPEFYRLIKGKLDIIIPDEPLKAREIMKAYFPGEKKAINTIFNLYEKLLIEILAFPRKKSKVLQAILSLPFKYPFIMKNLKKTAGAVLDKLTDNDDLKYVLAANTGYYHFNPYEYSMLHFGGAQGSYFFGGCSFIQGGSQTLVNYLVDYIKNRSGVFLFNNTVKHILIDKKRVCGAVSYNKCSDERKTFFAERIIANASIPEVIDQMLDFKTAGKLRKRYNPYLISHSAFVLYLGLKKDLASLGSTTYSTFLLPDEAVLFKKFSEYNTVPDFRRRLLAFVDYSRIDSRLAPPGKSTAVCALVDNIIHWEGLGKKAYEEKKENKSQILLDRLETFLPGIKNIIQVRTAATPLTMRRFTGNPEGAIYGYAQIPSQVGLNRPENYSGIPGLYFASAWSKPGGGFSPAAKCGYNAALDAIQMKIRN
ncbi:MAG: hypothetical protein A2096_10335 [Spirochaetes bacterium GWF1_41_5]|nr:MAG: hypothetical protein A2096_10335 [Spirochaetes bacterium GWF1_41_5]